MTEKTTVEKIAPVSITTGNRSLFAAVAAGIGASICCVGPFVLLALGIGGAWIGMLTALEPWRPVFIGVTLVFLGLAFRRLYLVPQACEPGQACANPVTLRNQRLIFWGITVILAVLIAFPWYGPALLG
jgi:mercuric ion transport protein